MSFFFFAVHTDNVVGWRGLTEEYIFDARIVGSGVTATEDPEVHMAVGLHNR